MGLTQIGITNYRSIRKLHMPLRRLTVLVGGNGVGKTNLYRSLELLSAAARGTLNEEIAREGGLGSVMFAGELKTHEERRLVLEATLDELGDGGLGFDVELGFPMQYRNEAGFPSVVSAAFETEAQVKEESLSLLQRGKRVTLMERKGAGAWARDADGKRQSLTDPLLATETVLSSLRGGFREIDAVRTVMANWRFFHSFRTDAASPLRQPSLAVTSPTLSSDGSNLAAVFATLRHIRQETVDLDEAIEAAFPGAQLFVPPPAQQASFSMRFPDMPKRQFGAHELSDGTLQFLALMGALLSYRLPPFIALNELETSLHPALLPALAATIVKAAERTQVWVVTHSRELADAIEERSGIAARTVIRRDGATWIEGLGNLGTFTDED
jgi:predicted ATPase